MRNALKILALTFAIVAAPAGANVVTFETSAPGWYYLPTTEDGFKYTLDQYGLFVGLSGNPGHDMYGSGFYNGGLLQIVAANGAFFTFDGLDMGAYDASGSGSQLLGVVGFRGGKVVGVDHYTLGNTAIFNPKINNWTTEPASVLAGQDLDMLQMYLPAGFYPSDHFVAVDNVTLTPGRMPMPEPNMLALFAAGLLSIGSRKRAGPVR